MEPMRSSTDLFETVRQMIEAGMDKYHFAYYFNFLVAVGVAERDSVEKTIDRAVEHYRGEEVFYKKVAYAKKHFVCDRQHLQTPPPQFGVEELKGLMCMSPDNVLGMIFNPDVIVKIDEVDGQDITRPETVGLEAKDYDKFMAFKVIATVRLIRYISVLSHYVMRTILEDISEFPEEDIEEPLNDLEWASTVASDISEIPIEDAEGPHKELVESMMRQKEVIQKVFDKLDKYDSFDKTIEAIQRIDTVEDMIKFIECGDVSKIKRARKKRRDDKNNNQEEV